MATLDQLYDLLPTLDQEDPQRTAIASASPLLQAMHLNPSIKAFPHMRLLDSYVVALCNLELYPDGPGPRPEVWTRAKEGKGDWEFRGVGFRTATSQSTFEAQELALVRPGSVQGRDPLLVGDVDVVSLKLSLSLPPRMGKSTEVTEHLPTWFLLRHPDNSVVVSTYNQDFADEWGKSLQDMLESKGHLLPLASDGKRLTPMSSSLRQTSFRHGKDTGVINYRGVGRSLTGTGWGLGIIDDPIKDQDEALSPTDRQRKKNWYSAVFSNRRTRRPNSPPPLEVLMFTPWHEDDLAGEFVYHADRETLQRGWCSLRLPALAEVGDPLGREPGESLCPELAPLSYLLEERRKSPTWFSCLYQCRPTHQEGSLFRKTNVIDEDTSTYHHWEAADDDFLTGNRILAARDMLFFVTMDLATSTRTTADWTVASLWGWHIKERRLVLVDRVRDRVSSESHRDFLKKFLNEHDARKIMFVGIEDKTFGTSLINEMRANEPNWVIVPLPADKDKITRATPYAEAVNGGKVLFPHPDECFWSVEWENEHVTFPRGKHDDQVDTGSMAWTVAQRYTYTAPDTPDDDPTPEDTPQTKAKRLIQRRSGKRGHDYHEAMRRML